MSGSEPNPRRTLTLAEHFICAWPIVWLLYGGAIGGVCGAAAWALNFHIMEGNRSAAARYVLVILVGAAAGALVYVSVLVLGAVWGH